jgi:hypothetical protein
MGFHIIYHAEGRDDVLSPIYTMWERAPETIVFDFACQAAIYNMVRAPLIVPDGAYTLVLSFVTKDHVRAGYAYQPDN